MRIRGARPLETGRRDAGALCHTTAMLTIGDNLPLMLAMPAGSVDLIATDPPYNTGRQRGQYRDVFTAADIPDLAGLPAAVRQFVADDPYLGFMAARLAAMHRLMKKNGSLWIQCDYHSNAYLRVILDGIFGRQNFRNEVIWRRNGGAHQNAKRKLPREHDTLYHYTKSGAYTWHPQYRAQSEGTLGNYMFRDDRGIYRAGSLDTFNGSGGNEYEFLGCVRRWRYPEERMRQLLADGRIMHESLQPGSRRKVPALKYYLTDSRGAQVGDIWADFTAVRKPRAQDQKPAALYERIIALSSNPGDLVLDPFAGAGVTLLAAISLSRRAIGIDIRPDAGELLPDGAEQILATQPRLSGWDVL